MEIIEDDKLPSITVRCCAVLAGGEECVPHPTEDGQKVASRQADKHQGNATNARQRLDGLR